MSAVQQFRARDERGFTLIELVIYAMLAVLVLIIVGGMLINSLTAQAIVRDSTQATNNGQLVAQSFSHGIRNARELDVATPTVDTTVLRVLIVDDAIASPAIGHCEAWHFGDGEVRTTRSNTAIAVPTLASQVAGWTLLATGTEPVGMTPIVAASGLTADLTLNLKQGDGTQILIETTATSRQPDVVPAGLETLCF